MQITIVPADQVVIVDGEAYVNGEEFGDFDMTKIPSDIHAFQWYGTRGEIEYIDNLDEDIECKPNELINELPSWVNKLVKDHKTLLNKKKAAGFPNLSTDDN